MSGIGEFAYTLLLGWMRALVDWFWSMFSGTGNTDIWKWFLSNWKIWIVVLVIGGLVVDWLMWVMRWRPYRLLLGRFTRTPAQESAEENWDSGVGYYEPETAMDAEAQDWTETTFATLSEIDPNWENSMAMSTVNPDEYHAMQRTHHTEQLAPPGGGYYDDDFWEEEPAQEQPAWTPPLPHAYEEPEAYDGYKEDAAYENQAAMEAIYGRPNETAWQEETAVYEGSAPPAEETMVYGAAPTPPAEETGPLMYGRPGMWPGAQFPQAQQQAPAEDIPPAVEELKEGYDPLFNPSAPQEEPRPGRRRRRIRENAEAQPWQESEMSPEEIETPVPAWLERIGKGGQSSSRIAEQTEAEPNEEERPSRLVHSAAQYENMEAKRRRRGHDEPRTVTGKPAKARGLRKFALLQEEAISGLPPLDLTDPFLPAAKPEDPDFTPDDGEEYY